MIVVIFITDSKVTNLLQKHIYLFVNYFKTYIFMQTFKPDSDFINIVKKVR